MTNFIYTDRKTNEISFPLGGIGGGCIGLGGNGRLIDWEIFNRPNKGSLNGMSHFAVKAEHDGELLDARILHGDLPMPYSGEMAGARFGSGFGWGPRRENLCGMPHFPKHTFRGEFPFAELAFSGAETFPGTPVLHAWSPFIPTNEDDSGLPGAFFEIELRNSTSTAIDYTVIGALSNPFGREHACNRVTRDAGLHQLTLSNSERATDDPDYGDLTLTTDADDVSFQEYWYRGGWCDDLEVYWQDFTAPGRFRNRSYSEGIQRGSTGRDTGHLAAHVTLAPNQTRRVRFVITWNVPNCCNYWRRNDEYAERIAAAGLENHWLNWYATRWADSRESGRYALENFARLHEQTRRFKDALFQSSLPAGALDAVSANLSTLKTPTCLRLEDGTFYGWEGVGTNRGSCEGSCTHVWNYAQALPFLFPNLERSMRTANYRYNIDEYGGSHFRTMLPLGIKAQVDDFRPCADGQFGDVIKTYRDWKISGDTEWLRGLWPVIRKTIEYAWSPDNPDQWDPDKTGVLWGRQHHTLDMELFGPNAWLTGYYLAALKAAAEMAPVCGDPEFGRDCQALFENGKAWADQNLFNGEYYHQLIDLDDRDLLKRFDSGSCGMSGGKASDAYWDDEGGEIKYQVGEGVEIDMPIAQWHANLYGLGEIYDPEQVKSTLAAIHRYNHVDSVRELANPWRVYALNDESATQICTWPEAVRRPRIPLPYAQEDQGGYTYAAAIQMIQAGLISEGMDLVQGIRDRYDGEKRNPWNEIECGSNYARPMASYALLNAFSGFQFDQVKGFIGFTPQTGDLNDFRCFWALDGAWGEVEYRSDIVELKILAGALRLNALDFGTAPVAVKIDNTDVAWTTQATRVELTREQKITNNLILTRKSPTSKRSIALSLAVLASAFSSAAQPGEQQSGSSSALK